MNAKDIQKAINLTLKKGLEGTRFQTVPIEPEDESEDIRRPSIRLVIETSYSREMMLKIMNTSTEVFFYAEDSDRYTIDCLDFEEIIQNILLDGIQVNENLIQPLQVDCRTTKGVHITSFTISSVEVMKNDETLEEVEEISMNFNS